MKTKTLVAMSIAAVIAFTIPQLFAHDGPDTEHKKETQHEKEHRKGTEHKHEAEVKKEKAHGHSHATKVPESVEGIWTAIHKKQAQLASIVADKKLNKAHDYAFAIRDLANALSAKVTDDLKAKAKQGAGEIGKIASAIDKSSSAQAQKATEANVKKMKDAITALQTDLNGSEGKK